MCKIIAPLAAILALLAASISAAAWDGKRITEAPLPTAATGGAEASPARHWNLTLQTGFAEAFQLTLGGVFGNGPAWQNKAVLGTSNVLLTGDSIAVSGWVTRDTPTRRDDWIASAAYRMRAFRRGNQSLHLGGSIERWQLPSVRTGARDWIGGLNGAYATKLGVVPFLLQSTVYNTLSSTLKQGTLIHSQAWFEHPLLKRELVRLVLRHGPQHTYSWSFYGANGHRVLRYAGAVVLTAKRNQFEAGFRPQFGLQQSIPDNRFWYIQMSRTF